MPTFEDTVRQIREARRGQRVSASQWNLIGRALRTLTNYGATGKLGAIVNRDGMLKRTPMAADAEPSQQLIRMKVKSIENDYLVCHTWDGTNEGTDDIHVAKPHELRHDVNHYAWITHLTTLSVDDVRVDDKDDENPDDPYTIEDWSVTPPYFDDSEYPDRVCEIWAVEVEKTGVTWDDGETEIPIVFLDTNVGGRAWAQDAYV